jgi:regulator of cell morphogenesis and NO signaling
MIEVILSPPLLVQDKFMRGEFLPSKILLETIYGDLFMENFAAKTVREIALEMPVTTRVFEEFKIDYCCGGRRPLAEACDAAGVSADVVLKKLETIVEVEQPGELEWLKTTTLSRLIDHILDTHHVFTRSEIENLLPLMEKVSNRHGETHPELYELAIVFQELCDDLAPHLVKEEWVLFPYIEQLERAVENSGTVSFPPFGTVRHPVSMMMMEHDTAGDILRRMREISMEYRLPEGACPSYTALYTRLEAFEKDLHQHIHLENNLLFPRAVELEQKIFG